ncbi:MAG: hypothetical protein ABIH39_00710, partial [Candidatus Margulisiibacteriota bacterium]
MKRFYSKNQNVLICLFIIAFLLCLIFVSGCMPKNNYDRSIRPAGEMVIPRSMHTATLLKNGTVLITGGNGRYEKHAGSLKQAEIYEPATSLFRLTGEMNYMRAQHSATLLDDGRVLITGGWGTDPSGSEIYDPNTEKFIKTKPMQIEREFHAAILLSNGNVLVAGQEPGNVKHLIRAEIYNPEKDIFESVSSLLIPGYSAWAHFINENVYIVHGVLASTEVEGNPVFGSKYRLKNQSAAIEKYNYQNNSFSV